MTHLIRQLNYPLFYIMLIKGGNVDCKGSLLFLVFGALFVGSSLYLYSGRDYGGIRESCLQN